jgi:preprotein translocase subunit YajC
MKKETEPGVMTVRQGVELIVVSIIAMRYIEYVRKEQERKAGLEKAMRKLKRGAK